MSYVPSGRLRAVPQQAGHRSVARGFAPLDVDGSSLGPQSSGGGGVAGYTHCVCGARSSILRTTRERRLWHTMHREEIAGVPWR
jgi:hypothetical protein